MKSKIQTVLPFIAIVPWSVIFGPPQRPNAGDISVQVDIVPVDVTVTDKKGRPVLNVSKEDFIVLEDGVRQEILHFSVEEYYLPDKPGGSTSGGIVETGVPNTLSGRLRKQVSQLNPAEQRTFLVLLGTGRQNIFRGIEDLIQFIRQDSEPTDYFAVMAYNRATDFTTDHEKVTSVLERYQKGHEYISLVMNNRRRGLAGIYSTGRFPESIQSRIDEIFYGPQHTTLAMRLSSDPGKEEETRRRFETSDLVQKRTGFEASNLPILRQSQGSSVYPFDHHTHFRARTGQDLMNIYAAIDYMRFMQGEKHILFFANVGLFLPDLSMDEDLARRISDARIRFHTLHTGGVDSVPIRRRIIPYGGRKRSMIRPMAMEAIENVSTKTGGQTFVGKYASEALKSISSITRATYLLGYRPKNRDFDDEFRRIEVRVNRKDLKVHARYGYYARDNLSPYDSKDFLIYSRTVDAVNHPGNLRGIPFELGLSKPGYRDEQTWLAVQVNVGCASEMFSREQDEYVGTLSLTFLMVSEKGDLIEDWWDQIEMRVKEAQYQKLLEHGTLITRWFSVPGKIEDASLKVVVYNPTSDKSGSRVRNIG